LGWERVERNCINKPSRKKLGFLFKKSLAKGTYMNTDSDQNDPRNVRKEVII